MELEIKLVELQIRHQHIAAFYTVIMSVTVSITSSVFAAYITLGLTLNEMQWVISGATVFIVGMAVFYLIQRLYERRISGLKVEIEEVKKRYLL